MHFFQKQNIGSDYFERIIHYSTPICHHFRLSMLTGEDDDEISVARCLMGVPKDVEGNTCYYKSALTIPDEYGRTPLHYLFENGYNDFNRTRYLSLIIEISDNITDSYRNDGFPPPLEHNKTEHSKDSYWNILLLMQNDHGLNPLHSLADNKTLGLEIVKSVIKKSSESSPLETGEHPLLCADNYGEFPIHFACDDIYEGLQNRLEMLLGIEYSESYNPLCDTIFQVQTDGYTPIVVLLSALLHYFYEDEEFFPRFCTENEWEPSQDPDDMESFLDLLSSKRDVHFSLISSITEYETFLSGMHVLLRAAAISNFHHSYKSEHQLHTFDISEELLHLAASVQNYPTWVLQMVVLDNPSRLLNYDQIGRAPIHSAIIANSAPGHQGHRIQSRSNCMYWESENEPRSVVEYILEHAPDSVSLREGRNGRLPIHLAICHGCHLESVIIPILTSFSQCNSDLDPITGLLPFMLAASEDVTSLDVLYTLLQLDPTHLE